ncbi:MAG: alpha/beta hydrolase [Candidatus Binatia bacterium]|nr:alpha/beta hydrolase [Candidatus Binatia bacterium]
MPTKYLSWDDDTALRYLHAGPTTPPDVVPDWTRGATVVFLHGEGGSASHFDPQMAFFGESNSPLALDLFGHGRSTGLTGAGGIEASAILLLGVLKRLSTPPVVLVGHGSGGHIALRAAAIGPDQVRAVVTLGVGESSEWPEAEFSKLEAVVAGRTGQFFDTPFFAPETSPDVMRAFWGGMLQTDPRVRLEDLRDFRSYRSEGRLPSSSLPVRILRGASDALCSAPGAVALAAALGASVTEIPDAGHVPQLENPAAVHEAILEVSG